VKLHFSVILSPNRTGGITLGGQFVGRPRTRGCIRMDYWWNHGMHVGVSLSSLNFGVRGMADLTFNFCVTRLHLNSSLSHRAK
jgi:hypothetical protein